MSISNTFFRFALAFSFFSASFALLAEPTLEEVVVSARKVDESVQELAQRAMQMKQRKKKTPMRIERMY